MKEVTISTLMERGINSLIDDNIRFTVIPLGDEDETEIKETNDVSDRFALLVRESV